MLGRAAAGGEQAALTLRVANRFEIFVLLRKLVLIGILPIFLAHHPVTYLVAGFLIAFMSLIFTASLRPYVAANLVRIAPLCWHTL